VQSLIALLPGKSLPEPSPVEGGPNDPRTIMWENYKQMRDRGALVGEGYDGKVRRIAELEAEIAELKAQLAERAAASVPPPAGDNVVPLRQSCASTGASPPPPKPTPPAPTGLLTDEPEPWRAFTGSASRRDKWADNRE
jgi:hypothetical protein